MIAGDTTPSNPEDCKFFIHHNLRVAYVAQHSFFHVEEHMETSPVAYIQWRFKDAYDKEKLESAAFKISENEQAAIDAFGLEGIWSRRRFELTKVQMMLFLTSVVALMLSQPGPLLI